MPRSAVGTGLLALLALLLTSPASADRWPAPGIKLYCSANQAYCLEVVPKGMPNPAPSTGSLLARHPARTIWRRLLLNSVAPVEALVSDSGDYVVTFDDWHRVGYGENVVVIYGPQGRLIRNFSLEELMTAEEIQRYTWRSVSSRWWGGLHKLDGAKGQLVLEIANDAEAHKKPTREPLRFRSLRIDLKSGQIVKP